MNVELFIARRLKLGNSSKSGSPSLNVALMGIVLAMIIMLLSVVIVTGFKAEISRKIYSLDSHLKITNAALGLDNNYSTVNSMEVFKGVLADSAFKSHMSSMSLIAEKPAILKTDSDFRGVVYRGVDDGFDWSFIKENMFAGRVPNIGGMGDEREIVVSKQMADQLMLKVSDKIYTYFIDSKVKVRRSIIVGIYNTDFETFDKTYILGNIGLLQSVNGWTTTVGSYVGVNLKEIDNLDANAYKLYSTLAMSSFVNNSPTLYRVSQIEDNNSSYFAWLSMLDMNVIIILVLMFIVSSFTLIAALLMIVLERIKMIGMLKALGASNKSIRKVFLYLTAKLIFKAVLWGNIIGIGLALLQEHFHFVHLNPEAYYMSYVPVEISIPAIIGLNIGLIVISYITLIAPSHIISTIRPTATMKFE